MLELKLFRGQDMQALELAVKEFFSKGDKEIKDFRMMSYKGGQSIVMAFLYEEKEVR